MGFCVAKTVKLGERRWLSRSMVTVRSCMASSSADCVLAGARLISSASRNVVNSGPLTSENSLRCRLKTLVPVMSAGIRSGVNWMRLNSQPSTAASVRASSVLRQAGHAFDQRVLVAQHHHQRIADGVVLPDDDLADLGGDLLHGGLKLIEVQSSPFACSTACISRIASSGWLPASRTMAAARRHAPRRSGAGCPRATLPSRRPPVGRGGMWRRSSVTRPEREVRPASISRGAALGGGGNAAAFRQRTEPRRAPGPAPSRSVGIAAPAPSRCPIPRCRNAAHRTPPGGSGRAPWRPCRSGRPPRWIGWRNRRCPPQSTTVPLPKLFSMRQNLADLRDRLRSSRAHPGNRAGGHGGIRGRSPSGRPQDLSSTSVAGRRARPCAATTRTPRPASSSRRISASGPGQSRGPHPSSRTVRLRSPARAGP